MFKSFNQPKRGLVKIIIEGKEEYCVRARACGARIEGSNEPVRGFFIEEDIKDGFAKVIVLGTDSESGDYVVASDATAEDYGFIPENFLISPKLVFFTHHDTIPTIAEDCLVVD
ncbi:MAG TPA: hypothetical protein PK367_03195 [Candidatus Paceibacterota bacterium]|nr:hypothetical protein [Candidatus Paceibacterota bacterium]